MRPYDAFDRYDAEEESDQRADQPCCKRCGSTDVRWRQQSSRWVLFSLTPGVVHQCGLSTDDFNEVPE